MLMPAHAQSGDYTQADRTACTPLPGVSHLVALEENHLRIKLIGGF
jgi:hypothetical protein